MNLKDPAQCLLRAESAPSCGVARAGAGEPPRSAQAGSRWPRMVAMARPVIVVVDAEDASRQALTRELEGRYGADYRIVSSASPKEALAGLEQLRGEGADVPLV